ncbi:MAG: tail fiber domain-containing protein, partial [Bacteroidota bacterium]
SSAGDWLANSDARLKKNILPLNSEEMLQKILALQGVTYEWNDDQTGSERPEGIQYGFTAQNIQAVFPTLVEEDKLGYLQTAYGTYDAMTVEAIRALYQENEALKAKVDTLTSQLEKITAALQGAGIAVEK